MLQWSHMSATMVVPARNGPISENQELVDLVAPLDERDEVRLVVARLLGMGYSPRKIAMTLGRKLVPETRHTDPGEIAQIGYVKIKRWQRDEKFRDLIWGNALIKLDLESPHILKGISAKAKRGRVDAARLALELTGRHTPKGDQVVANVTVQIANIPRPERRSD